MIIFKDLLIASVSFQWQPLIAQKPTRKDSRTARETVVHHLVLSCPVLSWPVLCYRERAWREC